MRTYEALYILSPELEEGDIQTMASGFEKLVTDSGGAIVRSEIWGKRKLAYEVKKHTEGNYVLLRFTSNPEFIDKLEAQLTLNESVIRFMVIHFDERTLRLEDEQERRNQEALRSPNRRDDDDDDDDDDDERVPARSRSAESRD